MLKPTGVCESGGGLMACINTYDPAYFTFGFFQFAAHVADGDFVNYFRELIGGNPLAPRYFPELKLNAKGHISLQVGNQLQELENSKSSDRLKLYLNPTNTAIEPEEVQNGARFIHWCNHDEQHRETQVRIAVQTAKEEIAGQTKRYPFKNTLHPDPWTWCVWR